MQKQTLSLKGYRQTKCLAVNRDTVAVESWMGFYVFGEDKIWVDKL